MPEADQAKDATKLSRLRLFVGGLHEDVTTPDLRQRFGKFGSVSSVDISLKRDAQGIKSLLLSGGVLALGRSMCGLDV